MVDKFFKGFIILFLIGVAVFVVFRAIYLHKQDKTNEQIAIIRDTKLTLSDVMGDNLPPDPGEKADDTIAGVDANNNGIRDDVELAIFKEYPNSAKKRMPLLQYAMALQLQMTLALVNTNTVTATVEDSESRAKTCMWTLSSRDDLDKFSVDMEEYRGFVEKLQLNNETRNQHLYNFIEDNLKSFGFTPASQDNCDIDLATLPN